MTFVWVSNEWSAFGPVDIPKIVNTFSDQAVISPTTVSFPCEVTGQPTPDVVWTFNGVMVNSGLKYSIDSSHTLTVNNTSHSSDAGVYQCTATNRHGSDSAQNELKIQGNFSFIAFAQVKFDIFCMIL